jgi:hypothetical protein
VIQILLEALPDDPLHFVMQALHQRQPEQLRYTRCMVSFFSLLVSLTFAVSLFGQQGDGPP